MTKKKTEEVKYTKNELLRSFDYLEFRDILTVFLTDGKEYTLKEIDKILKEAGR